jgi:hypothetical protein
MMLRPELPEQTNKTFLTSAFTTVFRVDATGKGAARRERRALREELAL